MISLTSQTSTARPRRQPRAVERCPNCFVEGKGFRRFVDFPRNAQDTFESTNKLLLKVLTLLTNDEVGTTRDDVRATHDDVRVTPDEVRMTHESVSDMAGRFEAVRTAIEFVGAVGGRCKGLLYALQPLPPIQGTVDARAGETQLRRQPNACRAGL
jgi:hypothetical protein